MFFRNYLKKKLLRYDSVYKEGIQFHANSCYPSGHFYSPIVSVEEIEKNAETIFKVSSDTVNGVDLNVAAQVDLLEQISSRYIEFPYKKENKGLYFYLENDYYTNTDAAVLFCMIKHFQPKRIIEIGSGFSSSLMLDNCGVDTKFTFIEPNPERLNKLLGTGNFSHVELKVQNVQTVPLSVFQNLEAGDFLFVDSSHVSKTGSDVNFILFEILPILKAGVIIHFHDIFYPFEYPKSWVMEGRNWNEGYILRAFLMHNNTYTIKLFNNYMRFFHTELFNKMPVCKNDLGSSLWLEKVID